MHQVVRAWGQGGLLELMTPVDLEILLTPAHLEVLRGRLWLQFLAFRAKEPGPVTMLLAKAPPRSAKVTSQLVLRLLHDTIKGAAGSYDKTTGAILHTGSRVLGFLNLVVQCRVAESAAAPADGPTRRKGAMAASPQTYQIGANAEAKFALKSDDLSVLDAILRASDSHAQESDAAGDVASHIAAFEGFLADLPGCLKTGPESSMARPHVLRKHLLVQGSVAPHTVCWQKMTWDQCRHAFPDVGMHAERGKLPYLFSVPRKLAGQLHVPLKTMSMFLCLIYEAVRPLERDYGRAAVREVCIRGVPALVQDRHAFRVAHKCNPSPAILVKQAVARAGLSKLPEALEEEVAAKAAQAKPSQSSRGSSSGAAAQAAAPDWRQILRAPRARAPGLPPAEEGAGLGSRA